MIFLASADVMKRCFRTFTCNACFMRPLCSGRDFSSLCGLRVVIRSGVVRPIIRSVVAESSVHVTSDRNSRGAMRMAWLENDKQAMRIVFRRRDTSKAALTHRAHHQTLEKLNNGTKTLDTPDNDTKALGKLDDVTKHYPPWTMGVVKALVDY